MVPQLEMTPEVTAVLATAVTVCAVTAFIAVFTASAEVAPVAADLTPAT